ncbi:hypothetical protein ZIOFF_048021 [Zingiber officinale]|uniref:Uncharacterized protein n=1 Tax=Zingiber officinale TaxID=94328 RepID=A0A8J5FZ04_ZINOF|nr:hypothetical protein ZIOFF_048021 [Zingiber officinale]
MDAATDQHALPSPPLVLHAPLISTRRSSTSLCHNALAHSTSALRLRVPFSWETSPGVPRSRVNGSDSDNPPPPKLPPGRRWADDDEDETNRKLVRVLGYDPYASGSSEEGEEDLFSDALEKISTSDRFDVACRLSSFGTYKSPGFIMDRFLPAANALAKSSVRSHDGGRRGRRDSSPSHQLQREAICRARLKQRPSVLANDPRRDILPPLDPYAEARAESPSMACGLMLFFPWSFKPTVCGFKSPARTTGTPRSVSGLCSTPNKLYTGNYVDQGTSSMTFKSPLRARNLSDGWSSDEEDNGGGSRGGRGRYVEKLSVKVRHSHGWRMPFLDTSRLSSTASRVEKWKDKARITRVGGNDAERKERRSNEVVAPAPESRRRHSSRSSFLNVIPNGFGQSPWDLGSSLSPRGSSIGKFPDLRTSVSVNIEVRISTPINVEPKNRISSGGNSNWVDLFRQNRTCALGCDLSYAPPVVSNGVRVVKFHSTEVLEETQRSQHALIGSVFRHSPHYKQIENFALNQWKQPYILKAWVSQMKLDLSDIQPLFSDLCTLRHDKLDFAYILVDMRITGDFPNSIILEDESRNQITHNVEYEWKAIFLSKVWEEKVKHPVKTASANLVTTNDVIFAISNTAYDIAAMTVSFAKMAANKDKVILPTTTSFWTQSVVKPPDRGNDWLLECRILLLFDGSQINFTVEKVMTQYPHCKALLGSKTFLWTLVYDSNSLVNHAAL